MLARDQVVKLQKSFGEHDDRLATVFDALGDPGRVRIFRLLMEYQGICVTDISSVLETSVSAASQQLRILELSGLVKPERRGQMICYVIREHEPIVKAIMKLFI